METRTYRSLCVLTCYWEMFAVSVAPDRALSEMAGPPFTSSGG